MGGRKHSRGRLCPVRWVPAGEWDSRGRLSYIVGQTDAGAWESTPDVAREIAKGGALRDTLGVFGCLEVGAGALSLCLAVVSAPALPRVPDVQEVKLHVGVRPTPES